MRARLGGKYYRIRFVPRLGEKGESDHGDCDVVNQVIRIRHKLSERDLMETILHEALHACMPFLDEEPVEDTAHDLMRLLRRFGYRKDSDVLKREEFETDMDV